MYVCTIFGQYYIRKRNCKRILTYIAKVLYNFGSGYHSDNTMIATREWISTPKFDFKAQ